MGRPISQQLDDLLAVRMPEAPERQGKSPCFFFHEVHMH